MPGNLWVGMIVYHVMTWQATKITHLKWSVGMLLSLFVAACGAPAPSQSPSSIPGASQQSQSTQEAAVIAESPVVDTTPTPDLSPTNTIPGARDLDVQSTDPETSVQSVVSTGSPVTPGPNLTILTPILAVVQPDIPARSVVPVLEAVADKSVPAPTPAPN